MTSASARLAERNDLLLVLSQVDDELNELKSRVEFPLLQRLIELSALRTELSQTLTDMGFYAPPAVCVCGECDEDDENEDADTGVDEN